jgi:ABC-type nickel/cobalt efflux system permease component RcnA
MNAPSLLLLLGAAATVAILHSILPDHWVPLAVVARTQRWSLLRVARVSALASLGHVVASLVLGGIIALIGLQFQHQLDTQQGHIIGGILILTGIGFLIWGLLGGGHTHSGEGHAHNHGFSQGHDHAEHGHAHEEHVHAEHNHSHDDHAQHDHELPWRKPASQKTLASRLAAIAVPFGVAASPDLTILPVALAASAVGGGAIVGVLSVFALLTIVTFIGLTILATLAGYQIKGAWLENNANSITSLVLVAIGIVAFVGF